MRIGIAEDHDILRQTMSKLLVEEENIELVIQASNGKELLKEMQNTRLDIVFLDLQMPVLDGRETMKILNTLKEDERPGIIILSMHDSKEHIRKYISMGANGFLSKGCSYSELLTAMHDVYQNGFHFNSRVTRDIVANTLKSSTKIPLDNPLSHREVEILRLICKQKTSPEISELLAISPRTVENHRLHIMKKIGAKNSIGLLVYAMKADLLDIEQL